ncbi:biotin-dependent carboxyltransferase family protein [Peribacillus alkalitolerans]|uniref:5-oxoprolinase subunit C family protein n=1 Tax=Peribacillus alkalitolerans TaxID=1550385 RepID=UPI0013D669E8|nr:biotin-dependent carboxyltransferase family protein [Peribacillus alkalitolerans]
MEVMVHKPGLLTTVQDIGRYGYQREGIIVSGAMDLLSMRLANLLVGNDEKEAVLEVTLVGPSLQFLVDSVIAISGGNLSPSINDNPVSINKPTFVKKGELLNFGKVVDGCRCYIAFKGGIQVDEVLGSKSTCLPARFGGMHGRALVKGDLLPIEEVHHKTPKKFNWMLSYRYFQTIFTSGPIRFIRGKQYDLFDVESRIKFQTTPFKFTKDSNRMGFRLHGSELQLTKKQEMITEGVTFGSIQVPPNGQPIILMADRQTTGGYPKIAQVISRDLPRLAQLKPGDSFFFTEISLKEAHQLAFEQENEIRSLQKIITAKWQESRY